MTVLYDTHEQAEQAVKQLQHHGYDMQQLSIVGRDYHSEENVVGYYNMGDRIGRGAFAPLIAAGVGVYQPDGELFVARKTHNRQIPVPTAAFQT